MTFLITIQRSQYVLFMLLFLIYSISFLFFEVYVIKNFVLCAIFVKVLSSFEYVEPNGKDAGINVRKKVETILGLINDKEKIKSVREKAASNRDK